MEYSRAIKLEPVKIELADALLFVMRRNQMMLKILENKYAHYSIFFYGSTIDIHQTFEGKKRKHIPFATIEVDWRFLLTSLTHEVGATWSSLCRLVKCKDPEWEDLEIRFLPIKVLGELLPLWKKGIRWNVDAESLQKLDSSLGNSHLGDLDNYGQIIGEGSGYLILSDGKDCLLFDHYKFNQIIEKNFELSIRKISLRYYTPSSLLWCARISLLHLRSDILNGRIPYRLHKSLFLQGLDSLYRRI